MIDLHTHTTASDGRCTPEELVSRAAEAGITVLGVTDHDTMAGCARARAACARVGIEFVPGIEITAAVGDLDVHVLGYFLDVDSQALQSFLVEQRQRRIDRIEAMVARLAEHGIVLDVKKILNPDLDPDASIGRPAIARELVASGHVADTSEAFNRWLVRGRPAFVARVAAEPPEVFGRIHDAGGIVSLAHPGLLERDQWIDAYAASGLDALEAYHSDHDEEDTARYLSMAERLGLLVSGGSDFHGDAAHGGGRPGGVTLPRDHYERLRALRRTV